MANIGMLEGLALGKKKKDKIHLNYYFILPQLNASHYSLLFYVLLFNVICDVLILVGRLHI